jgi:hypothetical protein
MAGRLDGIRGEHGAVALGVSSFYAMYATFGVPLGG